MVPSIDKFHVMTSRLSCLLFLLFISVNATTIGVPAQSTAAQPAVTTTAAAAATSTDAAATAAPPSQNSAGSSGSPGTCPSGQQLTVACTNGQCSDTDKVCLRDILDSTGNDQSGCCGSLDQFCPQTKLHAYHSRGATGYLAKHEPTTPQEFYPRTFAWNGKPVACPKPYSYALNAKVRQALPVDWDETKAKSNDPSYKVKTCTDNTKCEDTEFCGASFNPTFSDGKAESGLDQSGPGGSPLRFCYKFPTAEPNMEHVRPTNGSNNGVKLCDAHADCADETQVCHIEASKPFYDERTNETKAGICMTVKICQADEASKGGVLTVMNSFCGTDQHCENAGISKGNQQYEPHCRDYLPSDTNRKVCCFKQLPPCRVGTTETPVKKCTKQTDCAPFTAPFLWCNDEKDKQYCCKSGANVRNNDLWACPDGATPLFNEPFCVGTQKGAGATVSSGKCSAKDGGICHHGHCCPGLIRTIKPSGTNTSVAEVKIGEHPYITEVPCNPASEPSAKFTFAFCDPKSKKLTICGKFHRKSGDALTQVAGSVCTRNRDCEKHGNAVCVTVGNNARKCYYNPLISLRKEVSTVWKTVLIISLICAAIFLICTILMFVCYRSKSVFDKYKPKKKKGKNGKDKDSKSKDSKSKDSNSKESTKEDDKKGKKKKGKKGKKGGDDDGSTDSKLEPEAGASKTDQVDPAADLGGAADPAAAGGTPSQLGGAPAL